MAKLFDIQRVSVGPVNLDVLVEVLGDAPYFTGDDPQGTARVMELIPELADHLCLGDVSNRFGAVAEDTELAHLLEHVTVELVARTGLGGEFESGRTTRVGKDSFVIRLACPDDVLVCGALSTAVWVLEWAYTGGGEPKPDVDAIVAGLRDLVASVSEPVEVEEPEAEAAAEPEPVEEAVAAAEPEPAEEAVAAAEPEPEPEPVPEPEPAPEPMPELDLPDIVFDEEPQETQTPEPEADAEPDFDIFADWPEPDPDAEAALEAEIDMILSGGLSDAPED